MSLMPTTQRILILGGSGYLGVHLVEAALADLRWERVICASRGAASAPLTPTALASERLEVRAVNALDFPGLEAALAETSPTYVVLAAAEANGSVCEREPELAQRMNRDLPARVARWCAAHTARLVHCSTDLVFGATAPPPAGFDEEHPVGPQGVYGRTKAEGESAVLEFDPGALVARLPLLFGDGRGRPKGATDSLFSELAAGRRVVLFDDEWRQPAEVTEVARMLLELAVTPVRGRLHLAPAEALTRAELGRLALDARRAAGEPPLPEPEVGPRSMLGLQDRRPARLTLDVSRLRSVLGRVLRPPAEVLAGSANS